MFTIPRRCAELSLSLMKVIVTKARNQVCRLLVRGIRPYFAWILRESIQNHNGPLIPSPTEPGNTLTLQTV